MFQSCTQLRSLRRAKIGSSAVKMQSYEALPEMDAVKPPELQAAVRLASDAEWWSFWAVCVFFAYSITSWAGFAFVPQYLGLPAILSLPVVEISRSACSLYVTCRSHNEEFTRCLLVCILVSLPMLAICMITSVLSAWHLAYRMGVVTYVTWYVI